MGYDGVRQEKGIDVWIAVEALELTYTKRFDVVVLIASDSDFVPLVRKMNALGSRVMILSWTFDYTGENGQRYITRTSQDLLDEASYPLPMHELIDAGLKYGDPNITNLFVQTEQRRSYQPNGAAGAETPAIELTDGEGTGEILSLKNGFGFIKFPPKNLFFHHSSLVNVEFTDLQVGDMVSFKLGKNDDGADVAKEVHLISTHDGNFNQQ
jgi:cold shock CspA family protein